MATFYKTQDSIDTRLIIYHSKLINYVPKLINLSIKSTVFSTGWTQFSTDSTNLHVTLNQPLVNARSSINLISIDHKTYIQEPIQESVVFSFAQPIIHTIVSQGRYQYLNYQYYHKYDQPQHFLSTINDLIKKVAVEDIEFNDYFISAIFRDWFKTCISSPYLFPK